jgi:hypothetical protein
MESPYVGLEPFDSAHTKFFFGRTLDSEVIADNVLARQITVLYGPSGVGKSSILNVGLPNALQHRKATVKIVARNEWHDQNELAGWLTAHTTSAARGLTLLVFDQFEELFLYSEKPEEFATSIAHLLERDDVTIHALFAMRDDALHRLDGLRVNLPGLFETTLELRHLDEAAVAEAIVGPVRVWNESRPADLRVVIDPDFSSTLIEQLKEGGEQGAYAPKSRIELSYLQLALQRVWEAEGGEKTTAIHTATLRVKLKGAREIAHTHVFEVLGRLPESSKVICTEVLDRLVTGSGGKVAYSKTDLAMIAKTSEEAIQNTLEPLTSGKNRILRAVRNVGSGGPGFEVLHAILARPIYDWIQARIQSEQARELAADQLRQEREQAQIRALEAAKEHAAAMTRAGTKLKMALSVLAVAVVLLAVAVDFAIRNYRLALARLLSARSVAELYVGNADRAILLSLEAWRVEDTAETRSSVLRGLQNAKGLDGFLPPLADRIVAVAYSPDGSLLATGDIVGTVRVWDPKTRTPVGDALTCGSDERSAIASVGFSPDGAHLTSVGVDAGYIYGI